MDCLDFPCFSRHGRWGEVGHCQVMEQMQTETLWNSRLKLGQPSKPPPSCIMILGDFISNGLNTCCWLWIWWDKIKMTMLTRHCPPDMIYDFLMKIMMIILIEMHDVDSNDEHGYEVGSKIHQGSGGELAGWQHFPSQVNQSCNHHCLRPCDLADLSRTRKCSHNVVSPKSLSPLPCV